MIFGDLLYDIWNIELYVLLLLLFIFMLLNLLLFFCKVLILFEFCLLEFWDFVSNGLVFVDILVIWVKICLCLLFLWRRDIFLR